MAESTENTGNVNACKAIGNRQPADGYRIGHLVSSIKGRDGGKFYLVLEIEDESRVRVDDGEGRKVENPKRKNVKHLKFYDMVAGEVTEKTINGKKITNADVRKELKSLIENIK